MEEQKFIDASALYNWLWETVDDYSWGTRQYTADDICNMLEDAPSIEATKIIHANWLDGVTGYTCSNCNKQEPTKRYYYCPNCGAKMNLERGEIE